MYGSFVFFGMGINISLYNKSLFVKQTIYNALQGSIARIRFHLMAVPITAAPKLAKPELNWYQWRGW
jgi:hypothetical protein